MIKGVGIDIVETARIKAVMARRREQFLNRVFTAGEQQYCLAKANAHVYFAGRFAAKEAVLKALGTGLRACKWTDIEIVRGKSGQPGVALSGAALQAARERGIDRIHLSLSHARDYAAAYALAVGGGNMP